MSRNERSAKAATTPTTPMAPSVTKLCHIVKRPDFEGYGFNLHSEKVKPGQYIGKVDAQSPAEAAGLKEGDRIVEVNGVPIGSETHKQVVQRIKAIACEVRLLLIDVDGKGVPLAQPAPSAASATHKANAATANGSSGGRTSTSSSNRANDIGNGNMDYQGTVHEMPGASANISSISMISTKRSSSASSDSQHSLGSGQAHCRDARSADVTDQATNGVNGTQLPINSRSDSDKSAPASPSSSPSASALASLSAAIQSQEEAITNNNNTRSKITSPLTTPSMPSSAPEAPTPMTMTKTTPPPPSATVATAPRNSQTESGATATTMAMSPSSLPLPSATSAAISGSNGINKAGSLHLPMTAAEMRAKLMSKKKYDPKNESVDLRKKFDIIQKL